MTTHIESIWVFALVSKFKSFNHETIAWSILIMGIAWLTLTILHWSHPGGPAWGKLKKLHSSMANPIPGPKGFPLIGSINLMVSLSHRRIAAAAESCNAKRLMAFSVGETRVIVTCNADVAKEILSSLVFADRPVKQSAYSLMFNRAIGFAPYGVYWRTLRRIAAAHLFCPKQIKGTEIQRAEIAAQMVEIFGKGSDVLCVRKVLKRASLNNMMWSVFGRHYGLDCSDHEVEELARLVDEGYDILGTLNLCDHLPWLSDFDPQKIGFRCSKLVPKVDRFVTRIISEHQACQKSDDQHRDFVDALLSLQGSDKLSNSDMIAVLWEMIFRGTDTVAVLIEWILASMVIHSDVQSKVHDELDKVVGRSRAVAESDIGELKYLPAVIKEVLRIHPPGPLLSWARLAITDTTIDGYHVPAGTTAMVNMWAIARDPEVWSEPLEFMPERFVCEPGQVEFSVLGSDLRLAPFGSGRRTCPGKNLGLATVSFWVATLLHEFKWLPGDNRKTVDLSEVLRLSCEMANPLSVKLERRR